MISGIAISMPGLKGSSTDSLWYALDGYTYGNRASEVPKPTRFLTVDDARDDGDTVVAVAASEARDSRKLAGQDAFAQLSQTHKGKRQPGGMVVNGYEYGDHEANVRNEDVSDYSVHQFLVADAARDRPTSSSDDTNAAAKLRRARAVASQDHFNSEFTPSHEDDFAQVKVKSNTSKRQMPGGDFGDGYEYGDREMNARNEDSADYSVHQFLVNDDARDGPVSTGDDADAAAQVRRSRELASQDHFNSENTPAADDDFIQLKAKKQRKSRRQMPGEDYGDGYEYGDREMNNRNEDSADYSVHQFLANDDARDGPVSTGDDADAAAEVRRSRELASQDHFNSENTPAADDD
jgi:hypothetical protein